MFVEFVCYVLVRANGVVREGYRGLGITEGIPEFFGLSVSRVSYDVRDVLTFFYV